MNQLSFKNVGITIKHSAMNENGGNENAYAFSFAFVRYRHVIVYYQVLLCGHNDTQFDEITTAN